MRDDGRFSNLPRVNEFHPFVVRALAGSVVWTVAALWLLFSGDREVMLQLGVVTAFAVAFVATPYRLAHLRAAGNPEPKPPAMPFAEWCQARFEIADGTVAAGEAALLVLLAPLACAAGLTAVSLIRFLVTHSA